MNYWSIEHKVKSNATDLKHKGVRWVHKDGGVFSRRRLQAKLGISGLRIIGEGDGVG